MSDVLLGTTPGSDSRRDAIHVAVIPGVASELLRPGQRVGKVLDGVYGPSSDVLGIVDPYLTDVVTKGGKFWLCLLPNTVTGMRHHWKHPAFEGGEPEADDGTGKDESERWLRNYAKQMNTYDENDAVAFGRLIDGLSTGELFAHGTDLHGMYDVEDADELERHASNYLGRPVLLSDFTFSCSC